jgi:chitinase
MSLATSVKTRRLSKLRLFIALLVISALAAGGVLWARSLAQSASAEPVKSWFAGYVDVTATPAYPFEAPKDASGDNVVLSFVVADPHHECSPSWGSVYSLDDAASVLDLDRRIARLTQSGGETIISFGGQANSELATTCTSVSALTEAYAAVIDRYELSTIDLDLEGGALDSLANKRRAEAISALQEKSDSPLAVWLTLPVTPVGLTSAGTDAIADFLAAGVDIAGVNVMTMDYGDSRAADQSMLDATTDALQATHRQLGILYAQAEIDLTDATLWSKVGATPMAGQNDERTEVFSLEDAKDLNTYATKQGITRLSMWSLNRDTTCGSSYVDLSRVSDACSGVDQGEQSFAALLGSGLTGSPQANSGTVTKDETLPPEAEDDPATSPYTIWNERTTYLAGSKVVWHRNVYQAKWWTRGDLPDDAVLDEYETPWDYIGPVLPGETPIPIPTLPAGTYPDWDGEAAYDAGQRVMFQGLAFEAKWWTEGDSPEASSSEPDDSPWLALTEAQIRELLANS